MHRGAGSVLFLCLGKGLRLGGGRALWRDALAGARHGS